MTFKDVVKAISFYIDEIVNKEERKYKIYNERVEQGFIEPCFFIKPISESRKADLGARYKKRCKVDIMFFPKERKNNQIIEIMEILLDEMPILNVNGKKIRGNDINIEIIDDVLHFVVSYDFHLVEIEDIELMEKLFIERWL